MCSGGDVRVAKRLYTVLGIDRVKLDPVRARVAHRLDPPANIGREAADDRARTRRELRLGPELHKAIQLRLAPQIKANTRLAGHVALLVRHCGDSPAGHGIADAFYHRKVVGHHKGGVKGRRVLRSAERLHRTVQKGARRHVDGLGARLVSAADLKGHVPGRQAQGALPLVHEAPNVRLEAQQLGQ